MKSGCNRSDLNVLKKMEEKGHNSSSISRVLLIEEKVIKKFMKDPNGGKDASELAAATGVEAAALIGNLKVQINELTTKVSIMADRNEELVGENKEIVSQNDGLKLILEENGIDIPEVEEETEGG